MYYEDNVYLPVVNKTAITVLGTVSASQPVRQQKVNILFADRINKIKLLVRAG
jgi:hypothetical protein